tara:strand:- start:632 stop:751 length:120 start_codon:yes stop_codon:yes gene_type:complete
MVSEKKENENTINNENNILLELAEKKTDNFYVVFVDYRS